MTKEKALAILKVLQDLANVQVEYEKLVGKKFDVSNDVVQLASFVQGYLAGATDAEPKKDEPTTLEVK
jgi:hypothetical protein